MDNIAQILQAAAPRTSRQRGPASRSAMSCTPRPPIGGTRCCTSCCPIASPTGRRTRGPLLDRANQSPRTARPMRQPTASGRGSGTSGRQSGESRFQGGTLNGINSRLPYLASLGVTTLWIAPVFRQRVEGNDFHGYGVQDFLDVDARFGTRADLVALVSDAHARGMRVVLDIIFNHTGFELALRSSRDRRRVHAAVHDRAIPEPVPDATASASRSRTRSSRSAATTTSGRRICSSSRTTRARAGGASARAISAIRTPSTSAPTSRRCATSRSSAATRSGGSSSSTSTGSR